MQYQGIDRWLLMLRHSVELIECALLEQGPCISLAAFARELPRDEQWENLEFLTPHKAGDWGCDGAGESFFLGAVVWIV